MKLCLHGHLQLLLLELLDPLLLLLYVLLPKQLFLFDSFLRKTLLSLRRLIRVTCIVTVR